MLVQPYMIDVEYDENPDKLENKRLHIIQITKSDALSYDKERSCWYTYNHYRREVTRTTGKTRKMLQIGISIENINQKNIEVFLSPINDDSTAVTFEYNEVENIWFERVLYRVKENKETGAKRLLMLNRISGISNAGLSKIVVKQNGRTIYEDKICFLPSSISVHDYNVMINDLFRINESLIQSKSNVSVGNVKETRAERLQQIIDQLDGPMYTINSQPQSALSFKWAKEKNQTAGAKFRIRTEIEKRMNSGKHKVSVFKAYETSQIEENEMIKSELIRLKKYCEFYSSASPLVHADEQQIDNEIKVKLEKSSPKFQKKLKHYVVISDNDKIDVQNLMTLRNDLQTNWKNNNEEMNHLFEQKINRLRRLNVRAQTEPSTVDVSLIISLHAANFKRNITLTNKLKSVYQAFRDKKTGVLPMRFNGYRYEKNNVLYDVPPEFSMFATIVLQTNRINEHGKLSHIFEKAIEQQKHFPIEIEINGKIICNHNGINGDDDIVGTPTNDSRYRYYEFNFTEITSANLNGEQINLTMHEDETYHYIAEYLLTKNNRAYRRLDAANETIHHDFHLINNIMQMIQSKEQQSTEARLYEQIAAKIDDWLNLPVFRSITTTGLERLQPTQLFLHDPTYLIVWNLLNDIEESHDLTIIPRIGELRFGVKRVDEVYETWILYKMLSLLTKMGWKIEGAKHARDYFLQFISVSNHRSLKKFTVSLVQGDWKIEIFYEPTIILQHSKSPYYMPDYVFKFYYRSESKGIAYIDAKYRNYMEQGPREWKKDIDETAIGKYGNINPRDEEWRHNVLASFIVHPDYRFGDSKELTGENYHIYYNREYYPNMITGVFETVHKYGAIYMLPSFTFPFENWFRMVMEFRLNEYEHCWLCGSDDVMEEAKYTRSNYLKYYYTCNDCNQFWVKTHCQNGHSFIKRINTYHKLVEKDELWHIQCPTCGDELERRENEDRFHYAQSSSTNDTLIIGFEFDDVLEP